MNMELLSLSPRDPGTGLCRDKAAVLILCSCGPRLTLAALGFWLLSFGLVIGVCLWACGWGLVCPTGSPSRPGLVWTAFWIHRARDKVLSLEGAQSTEGAAAWLPEWAFCPGFTAQGSGCLSSSEKQNCFHYISQTVDGGCACLPDP